MDFVPIAAQHHGRMAELHHQAMQGGFLPSFGPSFLRALYRSMFGSGAARGIAAVEGGEVMGFVYYTDDHASFFRRTLRHHPLPLLWYAGLGLLRRPRLALQLVETIRYQGRAELPGVAAEIYAWAMDPRQRHKGLGTAAVDAVEAMMQAEGIRVYKHTVYADNDEAIRWYEWRGHELQSHFELYGRRWALYRVDFEKRRLPR
jgi:ribosomal protein S18 acetylase RimI-like enzyme